MPRVLDDRFAVAKQNIKIEAMENLAGAKFSVSPVGCPVAGCGGKVSEIIRELLFTGGEK